MRTCIALQDPSGLDEETLTQSREIFETHGFLKVENLFPKEWVDDLALPFLCSLQYDSQSMTLAQGAKIHRGRYIVPIPLAPRRHRLAFHPALLSLMRAFLGPDCILSGFGAVVSLPGAPDQHIHSDFEPLFPELSQCGGELLPYAITVAVPLIDIDAVNGPTKIWSGTHRAAFVDKTRIDDLYARHLLCGAVGSCYFWDYRTFHSGGANFSEHMRPLLYIAYTRRWFRDLKNPDRLLLNEEERSYLPEEARSLFPIADYWTSEKESAFKIGLDAIMKPFLTPL